MNIKPHYLLLDGLRGAAALMVLWYHVFEGFAFAGGTMIETFNHGHLGVDFFFMLSGFVISYAYDDRWKTTSRDVTPVASNVNSQRPTANSLSIWTFFKRRLIRLHPMVVMGAVIGLITYLLQGGVQWDGTQVSFHWIMVAFFLAVFLIPVYSGAPYDVRGNGEIYPLNGPSWSLFFEYIGNMLYALLIRRFSNKTLTLFTGILGVTWIWFVVFDISGYDMIGIGWTLDTDNFFGGLLRMLFPFSLGMLMSHRFRMQENQGQKSGIMSFIARNIFWIAIILMFVLFSMPYFPKTGTLSVNGIYELFCIIIVFPFIVWFGASGTTSNSFSSKLCVFLGDISYPLYIVHYPVMYLFYAWLIDNQYYTLGETWHVVMLVMTVNIILAYLCLKLYDEPVRKTLNKKLIS